MAELDDITLLADILLPGDKNKGWPSASEVVDPNLWKNAVSKPEMLVSFAKQVSGCKLVHDYSWLENTKKIMLTYSVYFCQL